MTGFTIVEIRAVLSRISKAAEAAADELNVADGKLGDGDLGVTVSHGWRQLADAAPTLPEDLGQCFMQCAQLFQKASSSSFGTLTATAFMAAAKASKGRTEIAWSDVSALLGDALAAMMRRGQANLGDKTVLDGLNAIQSALADLSDPEKMAIAAREACDAALNEFLKRPNCAGRARMFAERSIGLPDPGMLALRRLLDAI
jgi:dihydroxyacetone kinase-like protein